MRNITSVLLRLRLVLVVLFLKCTITAQAQYYMNVFHKNGNVTQTPVENIDSVNFNKQEYRNQNSELENLIVRVDSLIEYINDCSTRLNLLERCLSDLKDSFSQKDSVLQGRIDSLFLQHKQDIIKISDIEKDLEKQNLVGLSVDSLWGLFNELRYQYDSKINCLDSLMGTFYGSYNPYSYNKDVTKVTATSIASEGEIQSTDFPQYLKANGIVTYSSKLLSFDEITVGFGTTTNSLKVKIDETTVQIVKSGSQSFGSYPHGLTISDFIRITFNNDHLTPKVVIATKNGIFVKDLNEFVSLESYGYPTVTLGVNTVVSDAELRATSDQFSKPIWVVGDSYVSFYEERWPYQMVKTIGIDNFLTIGLAGGDSGTLFSDLIKALNFGTPRYLIWSLGMNDSYTGWSSYFEKVKELCASKGIELVLQTIPIPNLGSSSNQVNINKAIKASGYRYIDAAAAMSPDSSWPWYDGYTTDGVHPTALGAKVLAARYLSDLPEFLQNK